MKKDILRFLSLSLGLILVGFPLYMTYDVFLGHSSGSGYWLLALPNLAFSFVLGSVLIVLGWPKNSGTIHPSRISVKQWERMQAQGFLLEPEDNGYSLLQGLSLSLGFVLLGFLIYVTPAAIESLLNPHAPKMGLGGWLVAVIIGVLGIFLTNLGWPPTWTLKHHSLRPSRRDKDKG